MDGLHDRRSLGIWHHGELECRRTTPWDLVQYIVCERGSRLSMATWAREEENASEIRQRKTQEADKVKFAPGVTVGSLRYFRVVLIGPTQGRRLCR